MSASAAGVAQPAHFSATAMAGAAATFDLTSPTDFVRAAGVEVQPSVAVRDAWGNPVAGESVSFSVITGGGSVPASAMTNVHGVASTKWLLGQQPGANEIQLRVGELPPATMRVTTIPVDLAITGVQSKDRFLVLLDTVPAALAALPEGVPADSVTWRLGGNGGPVGIGPTPNLSGLPAGTHQLTVSALGASQSVTIRVFQDLWHLYRSEPSPSEVARIQSDFDLRYVDRPGEGEQWAPYGYEFDQTSTAPTRMAIIAKLDVLRRVRFSEPLPFTGDRSIYEWVRHLSPRLEMSLDCGFNTGGGGRQMLTRQISLWGGESSCKVPFTNHVIGSYLAFILVHEAQHSSASDPRHVDCPGGPASACDARLQDGSGHSTAALFNMWVYKYSLTDPPSVRASAKSQSWVILRAILDHSHSDPRVQAILEDLRSTCSAFTCP